MASPLLPVLNPMPTPKKSHEDLSKGNPSNTVLSNRHARNQPLTNDCRTGRGSLSLVAWEHDTSEGTTTTALGVKRMTTGWCDSSCPARDADSVPWLMGRTER